MPDRKHPLALCEKCPLFEEGSYVPTTFSDSVKVGIIGKAPGAHEALTGKPFTGPSGDLMERVAKHYDIQRSQMTLTNVVACSLPNPQDDPPKSAVACCAPRLESELEAASAPYWLALGGPAIAAMLGAKQPVSKARVGPPKLTKWGKVIPTWHSAYCLRVPDAFPSFVKDVGKIHEENLPKLWKEPEYGVISDSSKAVIALNMLKQFPKIVIDIEAASDKDFDDSHPEDYDMLCIGFCYEKGKALVLAGEVFQDTKVLTAFSELLDEVYIEAHNGKFDLEGISPLIGVKKLSQDSMLLSYMNDERPRQHGLKMRSIEDLGAPPYDDELEPYTKGKDGSFAKIPRDILYRYNAYDVCCTWDEIEFQLAQGAADRPELNEFLIGAANFLTHVDLAGLRFDLDYNKELEIEYNKKVTESQHKIHEHVGHRLNPRSWQQVQKHFGERGYLIETTNKEFLKQVREELIHDKYIIKFIDLLLENRKLSKILGTYIVGLRKKVTNEGRIRTTFLLHGTTSGRLASRNPNFQNLPRGDLIRNQFTADEGNILVHVDYSQIEFRVIATLSRDEYLRDTFSNPEVDIFNDICDQLWGSGNWNKEDRTTVKSVMYGVSYGRKEKSIAQALDKEVHYVKELMKQFRNLMPHVFTWQRDIKDAVLRGEDLTTPFGRKRSFYLVTDENREDVFNEALSFKPQSIASDINLRAAMRLHTPLIEKFDAHIKMLIHDAIVVECKPEIKDQVVKLMTNEMVQSGREFTDYVPFKVEATTGFRLGEL